MMQPDDKTKYIISGVAGSIHPSGLGYAIFRNAPMPSPAGSLIRQGTLFQLDVYSRSKGFVPIQDALLAPGDNCFQTPEEASIILSLAIKPLDIKQVCKWCGLTPGQVNDGAGLCRKNPAGLGAKGWGLEHDMVVLCPRPDASPCAIAVSRGEKNVQLHTEALNLAHALNLVVSGETSKATHGSDGVEVGQ